MADNSSVNDAQNDAQLVLKKRARRRLVGAAVFFSVAAVVLPMVMDEEPPPAAPNIEIRIPGQDKSFVPPPTQAAAKPSELPPPISEPVSEPVRAEKGAPAPVAPLAAAKPAAPVAAVAPAAATPAVQEKPAEKAPEPSKPAAKPEAKPEAKKADKAAEKAAEKAAKAKEKEKEKERAKPAESKRAQALLDGGDDKPSAKGEPHVVLIGAFANSGNVEVLKKKLGELKIPVYTESLDTKEGKKIRVRAGPFANKDAADKALERMKKIGVNGVVASKS